MSTLVQVEGLSKQFGEGQHAVRALNNVSFSIEPGEMVALRGPSGCGKSTLLHLLGAMDVSTQGSIHVDGNDLHQMTPSQRAIYRRRHVGFVFQFFYLLPTLTVLENILLPITLEGGDEAEAKPRADHLLETVQLTHRADHYPAELSGGEMQRTALARAVVHQPKLLLADEPTGSLDRENGLRILQLLEKLNQEFQLTTILATHEERTARWAKRWLFIQDGQLEKEELNEQPVSAL